MRTETIVRNIYTVHELREVSPQGFMRAYEDHCRSEVEWADWSDEYASLKALDKASGYDRAYRYLYPQVYSDEWSMVGRRAWAWLENVVLSDLRIPWSGKRRRELAKYGALYRPGMVAPGPLTGYYMDEVLLDALRASIAAGESVGEAMSGLGSVVEVAINDELDARCTEGYFVGRCDDLGHEFYATGEQS